MMDYPLSHTLRERKNVPDKRDVSRFDNLYIACYQRFTNAHTGLLETEAVFLEPRVWPDQCQETIDLFTDLQKASTNLSDLLAGASVLPAETRHQRYSLLLSTGHIHAQCYEVISILRELPSLNFNSNRGRERYEDIRHLLRTIQSNLKELIDDLQVERMNPLLRSIGAHQAKDITKSNKQKSLA